MRSLSIASVQPSSTQIKYSVNNADDIGHIWNIGRDGGMMDLMVQAGPPVAIRVPKEPRNHHIRSLKNQGPTEAA